MLQLVCKNLSLGYDGKSVVDGLNFKVNKGDYICIAGENGSGKTTLMKTLLKLTAPISGVIETKEGFSMEDIGYLPQQRLVRNDFPASVREIVLSGALSSRKLFYGKKEKHMARECMEKLGIADIRKKSFSELSGGQQQRALLARAVCSAKKMLLLDEPVSGLDPIFALEMYELIKHLNDDGITILMISHDKKALDYASHVLHIGNECVFEKTADYLKSSLGQTFYAYGGSKIDK